tara:strand:+ start:49 stop:372 length:324 start_codon:yes stop_codon:yes gene_type:complete
MNLKQIILIGTLAMAGLTSCAHPKPSIDMNEFAWSLAMRGGVVTTVEPKKLVVTMTFSPEESFAQLKGYMQKYLSGRYDMDKYHLSISCRTNRNMDSGECTYTVTRD